MTDWRPSGENILTDEEMEREIKNGARMRALREEMAGIVLASPYARLFENIVIAGDDECWEWHGPRQPTGHGVFSMGKGRLISPHRLMHLIAKGPIPSGQFVCHSCDNPPCCNPKHLWVGTQAENNRDSWDKGRRTMPSCPAHKKARGEASASAKLSEKDVRAILASGEAASALSSRFLVSTNVIYKIRRGEIWRHISRRVSEGD